MPLLKPMFVASALLASAVGIGSYTFAYAKGASYLSSDPSACANCHVMEDHMSAWQKSSHHAVATCQSCHTPPGNVVAAYANKGLNGFLHSYAFTSGDYPDRLQIRGFNAEVTEEACRSCHVIADSVDSADAHAASADGQALTCTRCHANVGHWVR
jgi:cytochrome c nitrite reductase small subunit